LESVAYRDLVLGERAVEARRTCKARGDGPGDDTDRKLFSIPRQHLHTGNVGGGETHGDRILDHDLPLPVSSEATPVCDVLQHGAIWILLLAVNNREGELEGCFRVACECDVVRFTAADFDTCQGVPSFCAAKGFVSG
jgi:hypothetical protein